MGKRLVIRWKWNASGLWNGVTKVSNQYEFAIISRLARVVKEMKHFSTRKWYFPFFLTLFWRWEIEIAMQIRQSYDEINKAARLKQKKSRHNWYLVLCRILDHFLLSRLLISNHNHFTKNISSIQFNIDIFLSSFAVKLFAGSRLPDSYAWRSSCFLFIKLLFSSFSWEKKTFLIQSN